MTTPAERTCACWATPAVLALGVGRMRRVGAALWQTGRASSAITGREFTSRAILKWANKNRDDRRYIDPGKLQPNAVIEFFNGSLRDEPLG